MSNLITVYRIEEPIRKRDDLHLANGDYINKGAYTHIIASNLLGEDSDCDKSPTPDNDPKLRHYWSKLYDIDCSYRQWVFAFESIESLLRWFYIEENLKEYSDEYRLAVYEVPAEFVFIGTSQTVFKASEANLIDVLDNSILWSKP
jgi:hypothetical protein